MLLHVIKRKCSDVPFQNRTTAYKYMKKFCSTGSFLDSKKIFGRGTEENLEKIGVRLENLQEYHWFNLYSKCVCVHACVHVHHEQEMQ